MKNLVFLSDILSFQDNPSFLVKFLVSSENLGFLWNTQFSVLTHDFLRKCMFSAPKHFISLPFEEKLSFSHVNLSFLKKTRIFSRNYGFLSQRKS